MASSFLAPRVLSSLSELPAIFRRVQDALDRLSRSGYVLGLATRDLSLSSGGFFRVSPPAAGMRGVLPRADEHPAGRISVCIENPAGDLVLFAAANDTVAGAETATFTVAGLVELVSNGVDAWVLQAQLPTGGAGSYTAGDGLDLTGFEFSVADDGVTDAKLRNSAGLSVIGRAASSSGDPADITATAANQKLVSNPAGTAISWVSDLPTAYADTVSGTLTDYALPSGFRSGDTLRLTLTANVTLHSIVENGGAAPPDGFEMNLCLSDQSGGSAPGWSLTIPDGGTSAVSAAFRTPGQVQGTVPGPSYVMQSEEEGARLAYQTGAWRIISGTAAQAITGDVVVAAGNGSTRTAAIGTGVIVNADVNASAGIALSKLAAQAAKSVVANATNASAVPTAVASSGAGQYLRVNAANTALEWGGPLGWDDVLAVDRASGANNPRIDTSQYIEFGTSGGTLPSLGDVRARSTLGIFASSDLSLVGGTATMRNGADLARVICDGDGVRLYAPTSGDLLDIWANNVRIASGTSGTSAGFLRIVEGSTSGITVSAGEGGWWVRSNAPCEPWFTDDDNVDHPLQNAVAEQQTVSTVSAATTVLATTQTYTIPANTLRVGSRFTLEFEVEFVRGATATALDLGFFFDIGGTNISIGTPARTSAGTYAAKCWGTFTVLSTGSGGTAVATIFAAGYALNDVDNARYAEAHNTSLSIDTTGTVAIRGAAQMNTAVANTSISSLGGHITQQT